MLVDREWQAVRSAMILTVAQVWKPQAWSSSDSLYAEGTQDGIRGKVMSCIEKTAWGRYSELSNIKVNLRIDQKALLRGY